ncbi:hypothetical protein ACFFX1_52795 [Dactylosporangium sucinum]|uniref:Uncharacterized protein n=1 Tax=Dactylosporangium sucinum TaxID=1424081 RepID=A0A917UBF5_9ACTN|nr:hypothetical protein [Dactylosporangium sucinum]GGM76328.1 hypothetical protein GCM10007977_092270 [Dactylosporangium sucinum]
MTIRTTSPTTAPHGSLARRLATAGAAVALASTGAMVGANPAAAAPARAAACTYASYAPNKDGSLVRGWGEKWGCGSTTKWTITVQRLRGPGWWQNEGVNYHTGDNWVSAAGGCVTGTWRTILESNQGHQMVSAHAQITC